MSRLVVWENEGREGIQETVAKLKTASQAADEGQDQHGYSTSYKDSMSLNHGELLKRK